jgi:hypothetical protein
MAFRRFLDRYRPFTNGGAVVPSRPIMRGASRETELQAELDRLYRERAVLAREEAEGRQNLARLQDRLDILSGEIDALARRTRDPELRERGARMIAGVKANASQYGASRDPRNIVRVIKYALGLESSPWAGAAPAAPPAQPAAVADPQAIVDAGAKLRGDNMSVDIHTGQPRSLVSPLTKLDPTARGIVRQGRLAKNEKPDD